MKLTGKHVHFVGIGGIGMSSIAHIAAMRGAVVSGCDRHEGHILDGLRSKGITVSIGHTPAHLDGIDVLVTSSAVAKDEPEVLRAAGECIPVLTRARMLAVLMEGHRGIGIAGAHGKTTTTWLTSNIFIRAGLDPTIMLGGVVADLGGNWRVGRSEFFITEVDESDRSLLELSPTYVILTNLDREHLDQYRDIDDIKDTFRTFLRRMPRDGVLVGCIDNPNVADVLEACPAKVVTYGIEKTADAYVRSQRFVPGGSEFEIIWHNQPLAGFKLSLPGEHNVQNALAAATLALEMGVPLPAIRTALANTVGVHRRLENKGSANSITVIDDYGHHPTEIKATLKTARAMAAGRLIGVFQPHRYSRTRALCNEFADAFDDLDLLVVTGIYCAGERPIEGVTSELILRAVSGHGRIKRIEYIPDLNDVPERLLPLLRPGDTLITIGAGNVGSLGDRILAKLKGPAAGGRLPVAIAGPERL